MWTESQSGGAEGRVCMTRFFFFNFSFYIFYFYQGEIHIIYNEPFKVAVSTFTLLCSLHLYPILKHCHRPQVLASTF